MLEVIDVSKSYPTAQGPLPVLRGVSLPSPPAGASRSPANRAAARARSCT